MRFLNKLKQKKIRKKESQSEGQQVCKRQCDICVENKKNLKKRVTGHHLIFETANCIFNEITQ